MKARSFWSPLIKLVAFLLVTVVATYVLAATISNESFGKTTSYRADFTDVTGLQVGDDVRIAGVRVGTIKKISLLNKQNMAEVDFSVVATRSLPTSSIARLRYRNLVGLRYLAIEPGAGDPGQVLAPNGLIPVQQTENALDLTTLFAGFEPLFQGLNGDEINALSGEIIQILQGEGGTVDLLLSQLADLTNSIADKDAAIGDLITNLGSVLGAVSDRDVQLTNLIDSLQQWVSGLSQDRYVIGDSIDNINALATSTAGLLTAIRPSVSADVTALNNVATNLNKGGSTLANVIQTLPDKVGGLIRTASYGSWFNFYLCNASGTVTLPGGIPPITVGLPAQTAARCQG